MKNILASIFGTLLSWAAVAANTWSTDLSDMYWNPSESGWGVNIAHQNSMLFVTMYVYGQDGKARWYVADGLQYQGSNSAGAFIFAGPLYEATGPYFGGGFTPSTVKSRQVGTATATMFVEGGTLTYSVDGVSVTKAIDRYTFRSNNLAGAYVGAAVGNATGCGINSGPFENTAIFSIAHVGSAMNMSATLSNGLACNYSATYTQAGRMGSMSGTLSCSNGAKGTFEAFETEASYQGFFTRYTANYGGGCTESGRIGGMKR